MATVSTSTWDSRISKRPSILNLLNSPAKIFTASVSFVAGTASTASPDKLDANSRISFSLKGDGKIREYFAVIPTTYPEDYIIKYDTANERMTVYKQVTTTTTVRNQADDGDQIVTSIGFNPIDESGTLADDTMNELAGKTVEFLVIGV